MCPQHRDTKVLRPCFFGIFLPLPCLLSPLLLLPTDYPPFSLLFWKRYNLLSLVLLWTPSPEAEVQLCNDRSGTKKQKKRLFALGQHPPTHRRQHVMTKYWCDSKVRLWTKKKEKKKGPPTLSVLLVRHCVVLVWKIFPRLFLPLTPEITKRTALTKELIKGCKQAEWHISHITNKWANCC